MDPYVGGPALRGNFLSPLENLVGVLAGTHLPSELGRDLAALTLQPAGGDRPVGADQVQPGLGLGGGQLGGPPDRKGRGDRTVSAYNNDFPNLWQ